MKKFLSLVLAIVMCVAAFAMTACGPQIKFGKEYQAQTSQTDVLLKLNNKQVDVGIMDSIMAGYYISSDPSYSKSLMLVEGLELATEQYGIAARKGSGFAKKINGALIELAKDGTLETLAGKYGIASELCIDKNATVAELTAEEKADWDYIVGKGSFVVGYTLFAPIAYLDNNDNLIGFDIELAKAVGVKLGLNVEFKKIEWAAKEAQLSGKSIDVIWNGMTITPEREAAMEISIPYLNNKQVAVIRVEDKDTYKDTASMSKAIIAAEAGSAGESCVLKED